MGAKNHQPTNRIITGVSAWLSQKVGEGVILVQKSNNHLEDAIMLGMNKLHVEELAIELSGHPAEHIEKSILALNKSAEVLELIQKGFRKLSDVAEEVGYKGNPFASRLGEMNLANAFDGVLVRPYINERAWKEVESRIIRGNILETLEWERQEFMKLHEHTSDFTEVMRQCKEIATTEGGRDFVEAVENNEVPVRQYGAQLLTTWNHLDCMFMYSALMMTELFYKLNAYPSLLEFDPINEGINVA